MSRNYHCFNESWFDMYGNLLEDSMKDDVAFFLCCYLIKNELEVQVILEEIHSLLKDLRVGIRHKDLRCMWVGQILSIINV